MKRLSLLACAALASGHAFATGSLANVSVVDRDSGATLSTYYYRGEYWVAGNPGARYAIEISNRSGGRLLAVTSVDGVNVLSGATASWQQAGYVFDPGERYQISGWRKSHTEVADFTFTDLPNSYAARTGRPGNVGIIGVAVFREWAPQYTPPRISESQRPRGSAETRAPAEDLNRLAAAPPAMANDSSTVMGGIERRELAAQTPQLGTGHGAREYSYVQETEFRRQQPEPNEVIRIRYDSMENLVAMGIVRRPHPQPPRPDAFPGSQREFVPDPPG